MNQQYERYTLNDIRKLYEETSKQLKHKVDPKVRHRVKTQGMVTRFVGVDKNGTLNFTTTSGTVKGRIWKQQVRFKDLNDGIDILQSDQGLSPHNMISLLQSGDLLLWCNDPSWKYWGWQYIGTKRGYSIRSEKRYPKIRNPRLQGSCCKHLLSVLQVLPFYTNDIVKAYRAKGIIKR